eukprot:TRINITY_DN15268_c0_g1_i4.p1 TRINITY_DN15268_c0_g1~~TRINITY_DN15268_c0_g1_i4.p1  ORF type:complete len:160 (-),score=45.59 TRINITY_DN15268_c0_g1_i4:208-687(-)
MFPYQLSCMSRVFFFFSSRRRHTRCREVSWARRCVQETGINAEYMGRLPMHSISLELPALFEKASKNQIDRKMSLYVTHDLVLLAFLIGLGMDPKAEIFDDVPFASYIQFELLKSADNQFMVNVTYNGEQIMMKTLPDFSSLLTKAGRLDISYEKDCVL